MRYVHPYFPGVYPREQMVIEVRDCATLGTNFADVFINDKLFASELSRPIAISFAERPYGYPNVFVDEGKMRTWVIEYWDEFVHRLQHRKQFSFILLTKI